MEDALDESLGQTNQRWIDCEQRLDKGYLHGKPFDITVVTVDGKPVEVSTANAFYVMQQAAKLDGVSISIVSGFRTYAEQEYLYNCYINCNCNHCNLAARPGYSNHQSGHALDLNTSSGNVFSWLSNHGAAYGFERTVPSENWHWEWWGKGPGGGPCDETGTRTPCTVETTGLTGECMDKDKCTNQGGEATPGFCPGPSNFQCCTEPEESHEQDAGTVDDDGSSGGSAGAAGSAGEAGGFAGAAGSAGEAGGFAGAAGSEGEGGQAGLGGASGSLGGWAGAAGMGSGEAGGGGDMATEGGSAGAPIEEIPGSWTYGADEAQSCACRSAGRHRVASQRWIFWLGMVGLIAVRMSRRRNLAGVAFHRLR